MPKYRTLSKNELEELKNEFVEFLVVNGIAAEDWEKMKQDDEAAAIKTINLFSDVVFESILRKVRFIEKREPHFIHTFQCLPTQLVLVAMESEPREDHDFTNPDFLSSAMLTPPKGIKIYTSTKNYSKTRESEIFDLIQAGCTITDDRIFKVLCLAL